jgi:hypothetical protein
MLLSLPLFFFSCGHVGPKWECHQRKCRLASQSASDLFFPIYELGYGLELRFRKAASGEIGYISIYEGEIPPFAGDPSQAEVWVLIEDEKPERRIATRLEGGQRVLLDGQTTGWLLSLIQAEKPFEIRLRSEHYSEVAFHRLQKGLRKWTK